MSTTCDAMTLCTGDKDARDCCGAVCALLAASATLQLARHLVPRHQPVSVACTLLIRGVSTTNAIAILVFTARAYARAVLGVVILSVVCLSVRPSVRPSVCHMRGL